MLVGADKSRLSYAILAWPLFYSIPRCVFASLFLNKCHHQPMCHTTKKQTQSTIIKKVHAKQLFLKKSCRNSNTTPLYLPFVRGELNPLLFQGGLPAGLEGARGGQIINYLNHFHDYIQSSEASYQRHLTKEG